MERTALTLHFMWDGDDVVRMLPGLPKSDRLHYRLTALLHSCLLLFP